MMKAIPADSVIRIKRPAKDPGDRHRRAVPSLRSTDGDALLGAQRTAAHQPQLLRRVSVKGPALVPQELAELQGERLVGGRECVGVDAQGHRRIGVAKATSDGSNIVALADRNRR